MLERENKISGVITWIGIINIAAGFILGLVFGRENVGLYSDTYEQIWSVTLLYWAAGFVSGMFFIGISEIIEQLHKINSKLGKEPEEDDLRLLSD
ncbi:hypothetical protein [Paenibacillus agri]|uniref:Uncharacterized protein n=1 Tax=Paenibacillus agri TaxID=2744309 RepID=A0A850EMB3_9BACL|nr:hypothetical protein [Paenibacillus agri]NUU62453.1 hypothetical protein [Paenibacillus agri]